MTEFVWRVGRKVGRTIYEHADGDPDGMLIGVMDTPEYAMTVVADHAFRHAAERVEDARFAIRLAQIVYFLASTGPPLAETQTQGGLFFRCTLCAGSGYTKHEVNHKDECPWLLARKFVAET